MSINDLIARIKHESLYCVVCIGFVVFGLQPLDGDSFPDFMTLIYLQVSSTQIVIEYPPFSDVVLILSHVLFCIILREILR